MGNDVYESMIQPRGNEYRSDQIKPWSHYREPVDHSPGHLAGNSRVWGDASPEVQSRVIEPKKRSEQVRWLFCGEFDVFLLAPICCRPGCRTGAVLPKVALRRPV